MPLTPIYGRSGASPVLNHARTMPQAMNPRSYSPWDHTESGVNMSVSAGQGYAAADVTEVCSGASGYVTFKMLYAGLRTLSFSLTTNTGVGGAASISLEVDGSAAGSPLYLATSGPASGSLNAPYYRYRLLVDISLLGALLPGDWILVSITTS